MATLKDVKRIVIKVGTSSLTHSTGKTNIRQMKRLVTVISDIVNSGIEVALVSSGAIGVGVGKLGLKERPVTTAGKQAAATVGQCELMHICLCMTRCLENTVIRWDSSLLQKEMWIIWKAEIIL